MKLLKYLFILLLIASISSCYKNSNLKKTSSEKKYDEIQLFESSIFEGISEDPYLEFKKGYLQIKTVEADSFIKIDNYEKVFLSAEGIVIMYYKQGDNYTIQTITLNAENDKHNLSQLIGLNKKDIEKIIQNKPFSKTETTLEFVSNDFLFFVNFVFDKKGYAKEIILGRQL